MDFKITLNGLNTINKNSEIILLLVKSNSIMMNTILNNSRMEMEHNISMILNIMI